METSQICMYFMNHFRTHVISTWSILLLFGLLIHVLIEVVARTNSVLVSMIYIAYTSALHASCYAYLFNFYVVLFNTFNFDKVGMSFGFCCKTISLGIKFSVMTVILCYIKLLVKFFYQIHLKTCVLFSEPDVFSFNFCINTNRMEINILTIR